jgi:hypothetical protein
MSIKYWKKKRIKQRRTTTATVLVCTLPLVSVAGTLCTLWTPLSHLNPSYAPSPLSSTIASLIPPPSFSFFPIIAACHFIVCAYLKYTLNKSPKNKLASEPPTPDLSSRSAERWFVVEGGTRRDGKVVDREWEREDVREVCSSDAKARIVGSGSFRSGEVSRRSYYG